MSGTTDPFQHAKRGDVDYFQSVELDVLENSRAKNGDTVFSVAVLYDKLSCCQVIYRRCPQLLYERTDNVGTALHYAAYNGLNEMIKFLLTARATLEQEAKGIKTEGVVETVDEELLMMVSNAKYTALHSAAWGGQPESAKLLLEADHNKKLLGMVTTYILTALHLAVEHHHIDVVELLVQADPDFEYSADNRFGHTPLSLAWEGALSGDQNTADIRKLLIMKQPSQCRLPIGDNKWTLLHHATNKGDLSAVKEIIHFWPDCCQLVDKEGQNFIHLTIRFEQVNILKYILELRNIVDNVLNGKDNYGNTPLHLATAGANQSIALALLDDHRVSKMVENKQGKKPLDIVSSVLLGELIKVMYPIQRASKGDVDFFRAIHVDVLRESKDEDGEFVLSIAAREGHLNCCEVISGKCPELLYQTTKNKITILHTAASNGKDEIVKFLLTPQHKMARQGVERIKMDLGRK